MSYEELECGELCEKMGAVVFCLTLIHHFIQSALMADYLPRFV